jgi:hypothetical protein
MSAASIFILVSRIDQFNKAQFAVIDNHAVLILPRLFGSMRLLSIFQARPYNAGNSTVSPAFTPDGLRKPL